MQTRRDERPDEKKWCEMKLVACVLMVKNEECHIEEWIIYHLQQGFDQIIVYNNASTDRTGLILRDLACIHPIDIIEWNVSTPTYQIEAYNNAIQLYADKFEWLAFFDSDEYFVPEDGLDIKTILFDRNSSCALAISWAIFGSAGHIKKPKGLLIESFQYRAEDDFGPNRHIKSIVRPKKVVRCINPHFFDVVEPYHDLDGNAVEWREDGVTAAPLFARAKLHHYFVRSKEHWQIKMARGYHDTTREDGFFAKYDRNEVHDVSAIRYAPALEREISRLSSEVATNALAFEGRSPVALMSEHGTVIVFDHTAKSLAHLSPLEISTQSIVYFDLSQKSRAFIRLENRRVDVSLALMTYSGTLTQQDFKVVSNSKGGIGFALRGGFYLSARANGKMASNVKDFSTWETFTPYDEDVIKSIARLQSTRWLCRTCGEAREPHFIKIERLSVRVGKSQYSISENFPLRSTIENGGEIQEFTLFKLGGLLDSFVRYNPLVYYGAFGAGLVQEHLKIAVESLREFGAYDGPILVFSDSQTRDLGVEGLRVEYACVYDRADIHSSRFMITSVDDIGMFSPILYMDVDVVVDNPVESVLVKLALSTSFSAQLEDFNSLSVAVPCGAALFRRDAVDVSGMKGFNSGIVGFPNRENCTRALDISRRSLEALMQQYGRKNSAWIDQPVLNYVLRKLDIFEAEPVSSSTRVPLPVDDDLSPAGTTGFVHFWPHDGAKAKLEAMKAYTARLRQFKMLN